MAVDPPSPSGYRGHGGVCVGAPQPRDGQVGRLQDAKEIHGEVVGDPEWVKRESDPVTYVWEIDSDHWYSLTERAEELEGKS